MYAMKLTTDVAIHGKNTRFLTIRQSDMYAIKLATNLARFLFCWNPSNNKRETTLYIKI